MHCVNKPKLYFSLGWLYKSSKVPKMIVPLNEKVNTLFSKSVYISQVVSSVLQMYHNAKAVLNALRKHYKFPKVLINVLVIFHLLHSTPKSLLCSWPAQIMT